MLEKPELVFNKKRGIYVWRAPYEHRNTAKIAGFTWHSDGAWVTSSKHIAFNLIEYAKGEAFDKLLVVEDVIFKSMLKYFGEPVPVPKGLSYMPFQIPGIRYAEMFDTTLIADSMGLGKTIQALGVANLVKAKKLLIICPASLRDNWDREIKLWYMHRKKVQIVRSSKQEIDFDASVVISYELAKNYHQALANSGFDMLIIDEAHYLKNASTMRTKVILGSTDLKGILDYIPRRVLLSGTPIPNRANEFHGMLSRLKPDLIDRMSYKRFINRFCMMEAGDYGDKIIGSKNEKELFSRLRSGFMVRRLKKDVLEQLPDKAYSLVVFPQTLATKKIVKAEKQFSVKDVETHGMPVGSCLPELRHELGLEMVKPTTKYVLELLDEIDKLILFVHHIDVSEAMFENLKKFNPVLVIGKIKNKQAQVDRFQEDKSVRVLIGSTAAGTGFTMTASSEVVLMEPSYVPGVNEQSIDRAHRIGQLNKVNVHYLVVEGTIGAAILSNSLGKQRDLDKILDGV